MGGKSSAHSRPGIPVMGNQPISPMGYLHPHFMDGNCEAQVTEAGSSRLVSAPAPSSRGCTASQGNLLPEDTRNQRRCTADHRHLLSRQWDALGLYHTPLLPAPLGNSHCLSPYLLPPSISPFATTLPSGDYRGHIWHSRGPRTCCAWPVPTPNQHANIF